MNILKHLLFLAFFCSISGFGQGNSFIRAFGNSGYDYGRDIKQDNDTGYVVTGSSSSFSADGEAYLLKLNSDGEFEWSHNYGGTGSEWGESLVITHDSTYAIAGYTNSYGAGGFDFYLVRIDGEGNPLWENYYGGTDWDRAFGLIQLPDSGFVMAGETYSYFDGQRSGYIVRTDKDGNALWEHVVEGPESFLMDLDFDGDSIVVCGGMSDGGLDTYDGYIAKYSIDGDFGWDRIIGEAYNDQFNAVDIVDDMYSFGGARGYKYPTEEQNMWMYRMDNTGIEIFDTVYPTTSLNQDAINDISIRFDQDYAHVGETKTYGFATVDGEYDVFMGKMNTSLIHIATQNYGEAGPDRGQAIDRTRDFGAVFLADTKHFSTGGNNILIIKVNSTWVYPPMENIEENIFLVEFDDITNGLTDNFETVDLEVYPNPFQGVINLPEIEEGNYTIFSLDGQVLQSGLVNSKQLDLSHLKSGSYLLTVETPNATFKKRLIKI